MKRVINKPTLDLNWSSDMTNEEKRSSWISASNTLWYMDTEGYIKKDELENSLTDYMKSLEYTLKDINTVKNNIKVLGSSSIYITTYLLSKGLDYEDAKRFLVSQLEKLRNPVEKQAGRDVDFTPKVNQFLVALDRIEQMEKTRNKNIPDFSTVLKDVKCNKVIANKLRCIYNDIYKEYELGLNGDADVREGYPGWKKKDFQVVVNWYSSLLESLDAVGKAKPRVVKKRGPKPETLVKKLNYCKEYDELKLKSINPLDILNSKCLIVYNIKTKMIQVYCGEKLSVKGASIVNFDEENSFGKICRNPREELPLIKNMVKSKVVNYVNSYNTKRNNCTGRITSSMILFNSYKR